MRGPAPGPCGSSSAAVFASSQRFLLASMIRLRPAALSLRLGAFAAVADPPAANLFASPHRLRCAAAIRPRALALMVLRFSGAEDDTVSVPGPDRLARSSAICASMRTFWASKPSIAALMISWLSFSGMLICHTCHGPGTPRGLGGGMRGGSPGPCGPAIPPTAPNGPAIHPWVGDPKSARIIVTRRSYEVMTSSPKWILPKSGT
jgi:hypothetical protein